MSCTYWNDEKNIAQFDDISIQKTLDPCNGQSKKIIKINKGNGN